MHGVAAHVIKHSLYDMYLALYRIIVAVAMVACLFACSLSPLGHRLHVSDSHARRIAIKAVPQNWMYNLGVLSYVIRGHAGFSRCWPAAQQCCEHVAKLPTAGNASTHGAVADNGSSGQLLFTLH